MMLSSQLAVERKRWGEKRGRWIIARSCLAEDFFTVFHSSLSFCSSWRRRSECMLKIIGWMRIICLWGERWGLLLLWCGGCFVINLLAICGASFIRLLCPMFLHLNHSDTWDEVALLCFERQDVMRRSRIKEERSSSSSPGQIRP